MEIDSPSKTGFTIYSKSGCPNCIHVKKLLQEKKILHTIIDCDEYLVEEKEAFLKQVETWVGKEWKLFPMVFLDGSFVGGFKETKEHVEKMLTSFEENIVF